MMINDQKGNHLLDGTKLTYHYEDGSAVEAGFLDGKFNFNWIAGPLKGIEGAEEYTGRKIGDKMYMVAVLVKANSTYVTFVYNFKEERMYASVIFNPRAEDEMVMFESGKITKLQLMEH
jgi:hypothetical protein